jgi:LysR family transcriptional regulator (chromosome initiation inhibitor)
MRFNPAQLETLLAITEEGSFDRAAGRLHVTPSAVSQRVRALERSAGQVLVGRSTPSAATVAGEPLVRLARQLRLLDAEVSSTLGIGAVVDLTVAVNADSLATWFRSVLDAVATRPHTSLRLRVEDQAYSRELLRRGDVLASVTSDPDPVQGCAVERLGGLRYTPAATPALVERHSHHGKLDWSALPMVVFNEKDRLQDDVLAARGASRPPVVHQVPSTADFHEAVRRGLGWAMLLDPQLGPDLMRLPGTRPVLVALYWQRWRLDSPALAALTQDVREAARSLQRQR